MFSKAIGQESMIQQEGVFSMPHKITMKGMMRNKEKHHDSCVFDILRWSLISHPDQIHPK